MRRWAGTGRICGRRAARPSLEGLERREAPATIAPAPHVISVQRLGPQARNPRIVLAFDQAMDRATTQNRYNYLLVRQSPTGIVDFSRTIRIPAAVYNAQNRTVTLIVGRPLHPHRDYRLIVNGNFAGLPSTQGIVLDGNDDGAEGGNFVTVLRGVGPQTPPG